MVLREEQFQFFLIVGVYLIQFITDKSLRNILSFNHTGIAAINDLSPFGEKA